MKKKNVSINSITYNQIKDYAERSNVTITTAINQALMYFIIMDDIQRKQADEKKNA